ncbi:MarR family transcriptional regulator [Mordavella massiliensis]|uniref:MarR family transcriptional regulator n=1 Tax=Mordavella massiliensis TaxID=1871024 RepID=A0A938X3A6_9CLOT|nr:MarR family transcriptional regulator [Mordavella massiliensis]
MTAEDQKIEELIFMMRRVGLDLSLRLEQELRHGDLSGVQVYLMVYLLRHHRDGTYLTEICKEVGVSKSTLSALLKKLRKSGYIRFEENPEDIRRKKVLPTEKLMQEGAVFVEQARQMEAQICGVLDAEEKQEFWRLGRKILTRFSEMDCIRTNKMTEQEVSVL